MTLLYHIYKSKMLNLLNASVLWNKQKLPNNTLDLQLKKIEEEEREVLEAVTYEEKMAELGDVLIAIGGLERFDRKLAQKKLQEFLCSLDAPLVMEAIDEGLKKMPILWRRDYPDGYHH